jgi:hypothetical protein
MTTNFNNKIRRELNLQSFMESNPIIEEGSGLEKILSIHILLRIDYF